ncbi:carbon-nitrogen hydrolase [Durotheca rogersii]|uniref:carbon-nitrogen hydrolase n=1 Tax=Durotheca rogersii TaxID=419775 RepID=UPI00222014B9|nr:carbon-nitrogen hydrolase [Durotheca rogersii]KAI5864340.1 carbon-nitrogen hydrolase [Durotheca rogersii]
MLQAVGQICSSNSMAHNLEQCVKLVGQAAAAGAKILFLPEASDYIATSAQESVALAQPVATSPFVAGLRSAAAAHKLAVHVGIHVPVAVQPSAASPSASIGRVLPAVPVPERDAPPSTPTTTKLYNRTIYIGPDGSLLEAGAYDKLHLFDYPDAALRESATTQAGAAFAAPFDSPVGRLGSLICFDLRFPEAALHLAASRARDPAQVLLYPSAFTVPTGRAHWAVLLRARAVETQSYVVAAAQVGRHNPGRSPRVSYGRSLVVDPWGRVLLQLRGVRPSSSGGGSGNRDDDDHHHADADPESPPEYDAEDGAVGQLGIVDIDLAEWHRVRTQMPLVRRTDVYPRV